GRQEDSQLEACFRILIVLSRWINTRDRGTRDIVRRLLAGRWSRDRGVTSGLRQGRWTLGKATQRRDSFVGNCQGGFATELYGVECHCPSKGGPPSGWFSGGGSIITLISIEGEIELS